MWPVPAQCSSSSSKDESHAELEGPRIADRGDLLNVDTGFDGYAPGPNVVLRVIGFARLVRLNASTRPSTRVSPASGTRGSRAGSA